MKNQTKYLCDCGRVYGSVDAVYACSKERHSSAGANELADALALLRSSGYAHECEDYDPRACPYCDRRMSDDEQVDGLCTYCREGVI